MIYRESCSYNCVSLPCFSAFSAKIANLRGKSRDVIDRKQGTGGYLLYNHTHPSTSIYTRLHPAVTPEVISLNIFACLTPPSLSNQTLDTNLASPYYEQTSLCKRHPHTTPLDNQSNHVGKSRSSIRPSKSPS